MNRYILDANKKAVLEPDLIKWAMRFEERDTRRVAFDKIGNVEVSTVFLGLDHQFGHGPPLLFETMTFGGGEEECERCSTWEEALIQHADMVRRVSEVQNDQSKL